MKEGIALSPYHSGHHLTRSLIGNPRIENHSNGWGMTRNRQKLGKRRLSIKRPTPIIQLEKFNTNYGTRSLLSHLRRYNWVDTASKIQTKSLYFSDYELYLKLLTRLILLFKL